MNEREKLYDNLPIISLEELNREAHPGGGTTIRAAHFGEGLVEDLYEAQLRGVDLARPEDVIAVAKLAERLDSAGFSKYAIRVDSVLEKLAGAVPAAPFMTSAADLSEVHGLIEDARMALVWLENNLSLTPEHTMEAFDPIQKAQFDLMELEQGMPGMEGAAVDIAQAQKILRQLLRATITILSDRRLHPTSRQARSALSDEDYQKENEFLGHLSSLKDEISRVLKSFKAKAKPKPEVTPEGKEAPHIFTLIQRAKKLDASIDNLDKQMYGLVAMDPALEQPLNALLDKANIGALVNFSDKVLPILQRGATGEVEYPAEFLLRADSYLQSAENTLKDIGRQVYAQKR